MRFALALWRLKYLYFDQFYCIKYSMSVEFCQYKYFDLSKIGDMHKNAVKMMLSGRWIFVHCVNMKLAQRKRLKILNGSHRFIFFYVAVITVGVLAFFLNIQASVLPSFRSISVSVSSLRYILFSAELPRYASTFVIGRTHQSLSVGLFAM